MRHVNKLVSILFLPPFLFSPSTLLAQSESPALGELLDLLDFEQFQAEYSQYETDYTKISNDESPFVGGVFERETGEAVAPW